MSYYQPSDGRTHATMKHYYRDWTGRATEDHISASRSHADNDLEEDEFTEFVLSSNWILRPNGVQEFQKQIGKRIKNPKITYDIQLGGFRIRCLRDDVHAIVLACNGIMDVIAQDVIKQDQEEEQSISLATRGSDMVRHISEWRASPPDQAELEIYTALSYPIEVLSLDFKATWKIPREQAEQGLTIQQLFPSHNPVKIMTDCTRSVVVRGADSITLHLGASSAEEIGQAIRKLGNILKYHGSRVAIRKNVIFTENQTPGIVELRYIAQYDRRYLKTAILDPTKFRAEADYKKLFEKGCFLRSPRIERGIAVPSVARPSPAVSRERSELSFEPFRDWKVKSKEPSWNNEDPLQAPPQPVVAMNGNLLDQVNPEAAPGVLEWATALPTFRTMSSASNQRESDSLHLKNTPVDLLMDKDTSDTISDRALNAAWNVASTAQFQSSVLTSPYTTRPTSVNDNTRDCMIPSLERLDSPRGIKREPTGVEKNTADTDAESTVSVKEENYMIELTNAIKSLRLGGTTTESNKNMNGEPVGGQDTVAPVEPLDPLEPQTTCDQDLLGGYLASTSSKEEGHKLEPEDLLSTSPGSWLPSIEVLTPEQKWADDGLETPKLFTTMNQKAPAPSIVRPDRRSGSQGLDSNTRDKINEHLQDMLEPLRFYQGSVSLKVEIGRFWFTKINWQHISIPGKRGVSEAKTISAMEASLQPHCSPRDLYFTNIISLHGGDANYVGNIRDPNEPSLKTWHAGPRRAFYEFWCLAKADSGFKSYFILEIDAVTFHYTMRKADAMESDVYVFCSKRDFDFRVAVEATIEKLESCVAFAEDVVASLKVIPQGDSDKPPHLEFMNLREWGVDIKNVSYRQVATYIQQDKSCQLHITRVNCLKKQTLSKSERALHMSASPDMGNSNAGYFPTWYETSITSTKAQEVLAENSELQFAEEAGWTAQSLKASGAIDDLLDSAANTVRQMDGVGYWVDNKQDDMRFGRPPHTREDVAEQAGAFGPASSYW